MCERRKTVMDRAADVVFDKCITAAEIGAQVLPKKVSFLVIGLPLLAATAGALVSNKLIGWPKIDEVLEPVQR